MGAVYAAIDTETGEPVAIKLIAQQVADDDRFRDRFTAEINALHRLRHVSIVRFLHSYRDEEGRLFYTMELVEGESLHTRIRREKKLHWESAIDIAIQVCSALKHAHDHGVIHRDLKPANLMIANDGTVKLVDFGIAKIFGDNQMTHIGSVLGTADYMAPEQAYGVGITHRTDLYALGNVLYAMLTGRPPFTGKSVTGVVEALKRDRPVPLDLINPELPEALVELVHQLLEKDPAKRPPTALVVMKRLQSMRAGLRRETSLPDELPTEVGPSGELNQHDSATESRFDSAELTGVTDAPSDPSQDIATCKTLGSNEAPRRDLARPTAATAISHGTRRTSLDDGSHRPPSEPVRSHAVTDFHLDEDGRPRDGGTFGEIESPKSWMQWITIVAMFGILAFGVVLIVIAMRPPTANQLYANIVATGDTGAMKTFLRRFPEDERFEQVQRTWMSSRLGAVLRRLNAQANLGVAPLNAAEEGFVSALQQRDVDPARASRKISQWLQIHDRNDSESDTELSELIELASFAREQLLEKRPDEVEDPRARELLSTIGDALRQDDADSIEKKLRGIIDLHANDRWAAPAVQEARDQLQKLLGQPVSDSP